MYSKSIHLPSLARAAHLEVLDEVSGSLYLLHGDCHAICAAANKVEWVSGRVDNVSSYRDVKQLEHFPPFIARASPLHRAVASDYLRDTLYAGEFTEARFRSLVLNSGSCNLVLLPLPVSLQHIVARENCTRTLPSASPSPSSLHSHVITPSRAAMIRSNPTAVSIRVSDLKHLQAELAARRASGTGQAGIATESGSGTTAGTGASSATATGAAEGTGTGAYNGVTANRATREGRSVAERIGL